jgi:hypothetical protein
VVILFRVIGMNGNSVLQKFVLPNQTDSSEWFGGWTILQISYGHVKHQVQIAQKYREPPKNVFTDVNVCM